MPKNVKGGTLWDFLNIHSVAKYQKSMEGTKKISEKISLTVPKKGGKSHSVKKSGPFCFGMVFLSHVRGFGCVENEVLSTYNESVTGMIPFKS